MNLKKVLLATSACLLALAGMPAMANIGSAPIPEPSSFALAALGIVVVAFFSKKGGAKKKK